MNIRKILKSEYRSRFPKGERLGKVSKLVNWEAFRPKLEPLFKNTGGRPHTDVVLMTKVLVLQSWYGLYEEQVERDCKDRITFMNFLGYPSQVPDARTIWLFKERISKEDGGKEKEIWQELHRQLDRYRVKVKQGQMKDAVFIELGGWRAEGQSGPVAAVAPHTGYAQDSTIIAADPGAPTDEDVQRLKEKCKSPSSSSSSTTTQQASENVNVASTAAAAAPTSVITKQRGDKAKTTRSKEGTWTQKRKRSYFGFKLHAKAELGTEFISDFEVTTTENRYLDTETFYPHSTLT